MSADLERELRECREELEETKQRLAETEEELEEFQSSSKELEDELQADLDKAEAKLEKEKNARERTEQELKAVQQRFSKETREFAQEIEDLREELNRMHEQNSGLLTARQHLEQTCDDLERKEREIEAVATDSTTKLEEAMEAKILLEQDYMEQTELAKEQIQRLKDEKRDLSDELTVTKQRMNTPRQMECSSPPQVNSNGRGEQSKNSPSSATSPLSTRGLVVIGDMLKRVKDMEERLAGCRNSLGQMLSSRENTPRSRRGTPRSPAAAAKNNVPLLKL